MGVFICIMDIGMVIHGMDIAIRDMDLVIQGMATRGMDLGIQGTDMAGEDAGRGISNRTCDGHINRQKI